MAQTLATPSCSQPQIEAETLSSLAQFFKGLQAYHSHPYQRAKSHAPVIWEEGSTRLLDYGMHGDGPLVLVIPSLINRSYILDLNEKRSLLRYMARGHIHPYLIDWGEPVASELGFGCTEYVQRIGAIITFLASRHNRPVILMGYCMGGLMALAVATHRPEQVGAVVLLATPWDFHKTHFAYPALEHAVLETLSMIVSKMGKVPKHLIQAFFYSHNARLVHDKFAAFAELDPASQEAQEFVAVERWVSDGISVTSPIATECLALWGHQNVTLHEAWQVGGQAIRPSQLCLPAFIAVAEHDHIVPPASALPLAHAMPHSALAMIPSGHVGMIIGRTARQRLWEPLTDWLRCVIK